MIGEKINERKWMPLLKFGMVQIHEGAEDERKRKEGRYISNPLGGENKKKWITKVK